VKSSNVPVFAAVEQTEEQLSDEIARAHVVCVVYSVEDEESLERVSTHWLPLVRSCNPDGSIPVVLVGNKVDLVEYSTIEVSSDLKDDRI